MAVSANQTIVSRNPGKRRQGKSAASTRLWRGTLAFYASGYMAAVTATGANAFAGVVCDDVDNSSGAAGDKDVEVYQSGAFVLTGSGFSQATEGALIYASDNYTVTTTATNNTKIGRCTRYISATQIEVDIDVVQA